MPDLAEPLGEGEGLLFVSGDVLRYQAPANPLTAHATFVANVLKIPRGLFRTYLSLFLAFFLSGIIHSIADNMTRNWANTLSFHSLAFFIIQACAIAFEDLVQWVLRKCGVKVQKPVSRFVGYVWIMAWFTTTTGLREAGRSSRW